MKLTTLLLLLSYAYICQSHCELPKNKNRTQTWEQKLHKDLNRNYWLEERPKQSNVTRVNIQFFLRYFELDNEDIFYMHSVTKLKWSDERLKWDPNGYGGVKSVYFSSFNFWTPLLVLNNRKSDENALSYYRECSVTYQGSASCTPRISHVTPCLIRISNWPYDVQKCTFEFGTGQKDVVLVSETKNAVLTLGAMYGAGWTIVDYVQTESVSSDSQLNITFILERNGQGLGAIIVFPSILLPLLSLSSILLDGRNGNRLRLIIFSVVCHWFYLSEIRWEIPKYSEDSPSIVKFYRFSLLFNMFLVVFAIVLLQISIKKTAPPVWVSLLDEKVKFYGNYLLWLQWNINCLLSSDSRGLGHVTVWNRVANLMNSVCLIFAVFLYCILVIVFIPRPGASPLDLISSSFHS